MGQRSGSIRWSRQSNDQETSVREASFTSSHLGPVEVRGDAIKALRDDLSGTSPVQVSGDPARVDGLVRDEAFELDVLDQGSKAPLCDSAAQPVA